MSGSYSLATHVAFLGRIMGDAQRNVLPVAFTRTTLLNASQIGGIAAAREAYGAGPFAKIVTNVACLGSEFHAPFSIFRPWILVVEIRPMSSANSCFFRIVRYRLVFDLVAVRRGGFNAGRLNDVPTGTSLLYDATLKRVLDRFIVRIARRGLVGFFANSFNGTVRFANYRVVFSGQRLLVPRGRVMVRGNAMGTHFNEGKVSGIYVRITPNRFIGRRVNDGSSVRRTRVPLVPPEAVTPYARAEDHIVNGDVPFHLMESLASAAANFELVTRREEMEPGLQRTNLRFVCRNVRTLRRVIFHLVRFNFQCLDSQVRFRGV